MTSSLSRSLGRYRCGAHAVSAKSLGALALGAGALPAVPSAYAQITLTTAEPVTAFSGDYVWFTASTGTMVRAENTFDAHAYFFVADPGVNYFHQKGDIPYEFAGIGGHDAVRFTAGQAIQGANFYSKVYLSDEDHWLNNSGYVGFRSTQEDGVHYGWIKVTVNNADATDVTINAIGYNTVAGQGITAGETSPVPEPATSAALLALGAAGLAFYRQRRGLQRPAA